MTLAKVDGDVHHLTTQCNAATNVVSKSENSGQDSHFFEKDLTTVERILVIITVVLAAAIIVFYTSIQPSK